MIRAQSEAVAGAATYLALRVALPHLVERRGLTRCLDMLTRHSEPRPSFGALLSRAERLAEATPLVQRTCLYRSLSRYFILRSAGHDVRFAMGVRRRDDDIDGHAWLEIDGRVDDPHASSFVVTMRYPAVEV